MLITLTYHCSMDCTHCLSDCKPDGRHMPYSVFEDTLDFCNKHRISSIHLSGGEMFEHPEIVRILDRIGSFVEQRQKQGIPMLPITLITNGRALANTTEYRTVVETLRERIGKNMIRLQVTDDPRFYPVKLTQQEKYRLQKLGAWIGELNNAPDDKNQCLYPQGRALENFPDARWYTNGPKCVNLRLWPKIYDIKSIEEMVDMLTVAQKFCTPVIAPAGGIKLGESALCPAVATIYDSNEEIIRKIKKFSCCQCKIAFEILEKKNPMIHGLLKLSL